jgi:hypothetical protein
MQGCRLVLFGIKGNFEGTAQTAHERPSILQIHPLKIKLQSKRSSGEDTTDDSIFVGLSQGAFLG